MVASPGGCPLCWNLASPPHFCFSWLFLAQAWPGAPRGLSPAGFSWSALVSLQLGFFKRAKHPEATVPQYHAVKILREDRQQFKEEKTGTIQRSNWGNSQWEGSDAHPILDADWHPDLGPDGTPVPVTA